MKKRNIDKRYKMFAEIVARKIKVKSYFEYLYVIADNLVEDINLDNDGNLELLKENWNKENIYNECLNDFVCWYDNEKNINKKMIKQELKRWLENKKDFDLNKKEYIREYMEY